MRQYIMEGIYIASPSMEPTLPVGAHYFVNKMIYQIRDPKRGEVIVFEPPVELEKELVKRVIAVPEDTLEIINKKVILNGAPLEEPYAQYKRVNEILMGDNIAPIKVPEGHYFVMGDNRDESGDSRDWVHPETKEHVYFVPKVNIKGKVMNMLD